jgi:hypothetical protein
MLHNLPEMPNYQQRNETPGITEVTPTSTNNNNKRKNYKRINNPTVTSRHPRNTTQYQPPSHHELQHESRSDRNPNWIPTIVNGKVKQTKKNTNLESTINRRNYIHNLLSDSTMKLHNSRANYLECCKHKVLLIGDSLLRGCAAKMIASLDDRFDVQGVVKPGSATETLMQMLKGDVD